VVIALSVASVHCVCKNFIYKDSCSKIDGEGSTRETVSDWIALDGDTNLGWVEEWFEGHGGETELDGDAGRK
ncbi:hypothetical protein A2U01_0056526, partial [Trifolium medium]|nr:hypothetical protein [Trifolium medium]